MLQPTTEMAYKPQATLMKKHSQTDLVSRLKTRKVLGVGGEDDDGEVHRSKIPPSWSFSQTVNLIYLFLSLKNQISQMLGNESKFSGREPVGLRFWILISAVTLTVVALMAVAFPSQLYETLFKEKVFAARISIRLYGGALLSISLIMWKGLHTAEKVIIQWSLLAEACYLAIQFLVTFVTLIEVSLVSQGPMILLLLSQVLFLIVTLYFYFHLRRRPKKT